MKRQSCLSGDLVTVAKKGPCGMGIYIALIEGDLLFEYCFKISFHTLIILIADKRYNIRRLRDKLVGNYYSDGTLETLAVHHGMLKDYLRFLAGDLSHHSRPVVLFVHFTFFRIMFRFDQLVLIIVEHPFFAV